MREPGLNFYCNFTPEASTQIMKLFMEKAYNNKGYYEVSKTISKCESSILCGWVKCFITRGLGLYLYAWRDVNLVASFEDFVTVSAPTCPTNTLLSR